MQHNSGYVTLTTAHHKTTKQTIRVVTEWKKVSRSFNGHYALSLEKSVKCVTKQSEIGLNHFPG